MRIHFSRAMYHSLVGLRYPKSPSALGSAVSAQRTFLVIFILEVLYLPYWRRRFVGNTDSTSCTEYPSTSACAGSAVVRTSRGTVHSDNWSAYLKCFSEGPLEVRDLEVRNSPQCARAHTCASGRGISMQMCKLLLGKQKNSCRCQDKHKISEKY